MGRENCAHSDLNTEVGSIETYWFNRNLMCCFRGQLWTTVDTYGYFFGATFSFTHVFFLWTVHMGPWTYMDVSMDLYGIYFHTICTFILYIYIYIHGIMYLYSHIIFGSYIWEGDNREGDCSNSDLNTEVASFFFSVLCSRQDNVCSLYDVVVWCRFAASANKLIDNELHSFLVQY